MLEKMLDSVYISTDECNFGKHTEIVISVIYINKFIYDYKYWVNIRELTRNSGATYVSNYLIGDKRIEYIFSKFDKIQL